MLKVILESAKTKPKYKKLKDMLKSGCTKRDVLDFISIPTEDSQYQYFTHCTRGGNTAIDNMLKSGVELKNGKLWACCGELRDSDAPYVVFKIKKSEVPDYVAHTGNDQDNAGSRIYKEYVFTKAIPASNIVKTGYRVEDTTGFSIMEHELAKYAFDNPDDPDQSDVPEPWNKLFKL